MSVFRVSRKPFTPMRKLLSIAVLLTLAYFGFENFAFQGTKPSSSPSQSEGIETAYRDRRSDVQVTGIGEVISVLSDDNDGSRHQRFILRLDSGQTLLVAHNIDLAPRVANIRTGDSVEFNGEYEWNAKGGVLHWTHHAPQGDHADGWLKHNGRTYQ